MTEGVSANVEREERMAARQERIEKRIKLREAGDGVDKRKKIEERKEFVKAKAQISESRARLEKVKQRGTDSVTDIRVASDDRENSRRIDEEVRRKERRQKLFNEAETSAKRNAAIAMKWSSLLEKEIPQDLLQEIEAQREACRSVIDAKNRLISEFQKDLKMKDDEYVKALKKQADDIDLLLERMHKQTRELRKAHEDELEEIESTFMREREALIDTNEKEMDDLFEKRRKMEVDFMEKSHARDESYMSQLEQLRQQDAEDYNVLKIKLETEIQTLEQQLEEMRAMWQLNSEKLEYNYRVLTERDMENISTIGQQKRKLSRLQDVLSGLVAKYHKADKHYRQENIDLTDEYRRITEQFKDLQNKFRHFEQADNKKYREVWKMNEETVMELVHRILQADQIICEHQLGLKWVAPKEDLFKSGLPDANGMSKPSSAGGEGGAKSGDGMEEENAEEGGSQGDNQGGAQETQGSGRGLIEQLQNYDDEEQGERVIRMTKLLCDEAGFLVESKVRRVLATCQDEGEGEMLRVEAILRALNIDNRDDVEKLLAFFCQEDPINGEQWIHPNEAIKSIRHFVEDQQRRNAGRPTVKKVTTSFVEKRVFSKEEKEFWERMSSVVSEKHFRVWMNLFKALQNYNILLQDRYTLIQDTESMKSQNDELKALLNQYLRSQINHELHVPPTQVLGLTQPNRR